jgi:putative toxin-antitoxin system antitoxin component (TIGR02293 family)
VQKTVKPISVKWAVDGSSPTSAFVLVVDMDRSDDSVGDAGLYNAAFERPKKINFGKLKQGEYEALRAAIFGNFQKRAGVKASSTLKDSSAISRRSEPLSELASHGDTWAGGRHLWQCFFIIPRKGESKVALYESFSGGKELLYIDFGSSAAVNNVNMGRVLKQGISSSFVCKWAAQRPTFTRDQIAMGLRVTTKTLKRWETEPEKVLTPSQSEGFAYFEHVFQRAINVLGNEEQATLWLNRPALALDHETPIDLLETSIGAQCVLDQLNRIEYGVLA